VTPWSTAAIGDVAEIVSGATPKTGDAAYWDGGVPWATPRDLSCLEGPTIALTERTLTSAGLASCAASLLPAGSVLLSSRAPIGHVAINTVPMATNQGFKSLVPHRGLLEAKYAYHWLRANTAYLESLGNGATFKELSKAALSRVSIPLPPMEEQLRIAAILDQADALRAKRREALAAVKALTRSIFVSVFGHPLVNDRGWPERELQGLGRVVTGKTPPTAEQAMFGGPIPFVTPGDLGSGRPPKRTLTEAGATHSRVVRRGATLVCCIGATIGKVGRAECASAFNQQINAVEWNEAVHDAYGYASLEFRRGVIAAAGTSTTLPLLNKSGFQRLRIPVPPSELQLEYARQVRLAERVATDHSTQLDQFDVLFASLQDRAFKGDL